jgi:hypothetical protein
MNDLVWNVGILSVGAGVLTVIAALGLGIYVVLNGFQPRR